MQSFFQMKPPCCSRFHSLSEQDSVSGSPWLGLCNQFGQFLFLLSLHAVGHVPVHNPPAAAAQHLLSPHGSGNAVLNRRWFTKRLLHCTPTKEEHGSPSNSWMFSKKCFLKRNHIAMGRWASNKLAAKSHLYFWGTRWILKLHFYKVQKL